MLKIAFSNPMENANSHGSRINQVFVIICVILKSKLTQQKIPRHMSSSEHSMLLKSGSWNSAEHPVVDEMKFLLKCIECLFDIFC